MTTLLTVPVSSRLSKVRLVSSLFAGALTACANFSGIEPAERILDAQYIGIKPASQNPSALPEISVEPQWWRLFRDSQLDHLIDLALANNPSLHIAQARITRAQATSDSIGSLNQPSIQGSADFTRQLFTSNGMYPPPLAGTVREIGTLQISGNWEFDFFGKNNAALVSALGQVRAAQAEASAARMLLATNIARTYFQMARIYAQLGIAKQYLRQREDMRDLVKQRFSAGLDTELELQQSEGALPDALLQIEVLQEQLQLTHNAIAALVAKPNESVVLRPPAQLPQKLIDAPKTIPMDLLSRRADVAASMQRVNAAIGDMDNSKAQFYPNFNLVAFSGLSSIGFDRLLESGSQQWAVGPALRLPIFDSGRLRANLRAKTSDLDASVASYNATVIDAVRDVLDQLASSKAIARQQLEQAKSQAQTQVGYDITKQRFDAGIGTALNVLTAHGALLAQQRQEVELSARAIDTQIQLIRSLGGGFQDSTYRAVRP